MYVASAARAASLAMAHSSSPPSSDFAAMSMTYQPSSISTRSHPPSSSGSFSISTEPNRCFGAVSLGVAVFWNWNSTSISRLRSGRCSVRSHRSKLP